jgi:prophage antirepressor-like protein
LNDTYERRPSACAETQFEQYADWVFNEIIPELHRRGEMTKEKLLADFMKNEGRMTSMPDFSWLKEGKKEQAGD